VIRLLAFGAILGAGVLPHAFVTGIAAGVVAFVITDSIRRGRSDRG
jgi:hypothetical protein